MERLTIELIPDKEEGGFTARVPDIPAYGEGETQREAISDLKRGLRAYIAEYGLRDALARVNQPSVLKQVRMNLKGFSRV